MTARQRCQALNKDLEANGLLGLEVRYVPGDDGYYVCRKGAESAYAALGVGTDFPAHNLGYVEVRAFVGGLIASREWSS